MQQAQAAMSWTKALTSKVIPSFVWSLADDSSVTIHMFIINVQNLYTLYNYSNAYMV